MTTFQNGPAMGQTLMLQRTPIFLRVTQENGKFDALNLPEDRPRPSEKLYAYILTKRNGSVHLNCRRKGSVNTRVSGSGFYLIVEYSFVEHQPDEHVMRDVTKWAAWVELAAVVYKTQIERLFA